MRSAPACRSPTVHGPRRRQPSASRRPARRACAPLLRFAPRLALSAWAAAAPAAQAQESAQSEANNPLTPKITLNLHDDFIGDLSGEPDATANEFLLRGLAPHAIGGLPQLLRYTLPVVTTPTPAGNRTNLGDLTLIDLFAFQAGHVELAAGPLLVAPTGANDATGAGKWQAGAAGVLIAPQKWGLYGGLLTYQHSFAGDSRRPVVSLLTFQPLLIRNLPQGWYLRSTATWSFAFAGSPDYIPLGAGFGKVWATKSVTVNAFVEPQVTVWKNGPGAPLWQVFTGVTLQFPLRR